MRQVTLRQLRREASVAWLRDYLPCSVTYYGKPVARIVAQPNEVDLKQAVAKEAPCQEKESYSKEKLKLSEELISPQESKPLTLGELLKI